ncbi:GntR family transcriptional regulator [Paenibacillus psychroresistens]|uniref:GntR family transcriptional regulator n=1 Tax=Paenibacillus psychroresistens TaxID=1778678 RepID=A0A6B8RQI6_9BACL|nr:GntR family transcriptional regulator [Paenibacillus psychroresistens]QGQ98064.1 GntR family transcriptional regulator [Paenibacillus psychroresistens]
MIDNVELTLSPSELENSGDMKEDVYTLLKRMIMKREFTPNERLDAYEIAKQLNTSRTPVRDALNKLDAEGFIKTFPRKGTFVTGIYKQDLIHLFQYREMNELYALELGFEKLCVQTAKFELEIAKWDEMLKAEEYDGTLIMESDVLFHKHIVHSTDNPIMINLFENVNCHVHIARGYYLQDTQRMLEASQEHKAILNNLLDKNKAGAKAALKQHLDNTLDGLLKMIAIYKIF